MTNPDELSRKGAETKPPVTEYGESANNADMETSQTSNSSADSGARNEEETKEEQLENGSFSTACETYNKGDYAEAKEIFQRVASEDPDSESGRISRAQLEFLKTDPMPWFHKWMAYAVVGFLVAMNTSNKVSSNRFFLSAQEATSRIQASYERTLNILYFMMGALALYWIINSIRWPIVFQAEQRYSRALGWLWFIGISTTIAGILGVLNVLNVFGLQHDELIIQGVVGLAVLMAAFITSKTDSRVGLAVFAIVSLAWALDMAPVLGGIAYSKYLQTEIGFFGYVWAIVHLIGLSELARGVGGARGLHALTKLK